jgi:hypothetical protein
LITWLIKPRSRLSLHQKLPSVVDPAIQRGLYR